MKKFMLIFDIENAAFQDGSGREETARILEKVAEQVKAGINGDKIRDVNGNTVGNWMVH
jgi:hypothetical protein